MLRPALTWEQVTRPAVEPRPVSPPQPPAEQIAVANQPNACSLPAADGLPEPATAPTPAETAYQQHLVEFASLAGPSNTQLLRTFLAAVWTFEQNSKSEAAQPQQKACLPDSILLDVSASDKAHRAAVHGFFRRPGLPRLETDSVTAEGKNARDELGTSGVHAIAVAYKPAVSLSRTN